MAGRRPGKAADSARPTEVVLTGSSVSGGADPGEHEPQVPGPRDELGIRELSYHRRKPAILGLDVHRQYVWTLLDPESAIPPAKDAIRIESPKAES